MTEPLAELLHALHARYGCDLRQYSPASLRRRVDVALARFRLGSVDELRERVIADPKMFGALLDCITVQVTEPFRDPQLYRVLRERVVPSLRTYPFLKIWHAGCATGEEVYAMAILLDEEGLHERSQIYATDLSPDAVRRASEGIYPATSAAKLAENHHLSGGSGDVSRYYHAAYDRIVYDQRLKENILFFQHDLVADHAFGEMQLIFCRNVLIYFDQELRRTVLHKLEESLCHGGYLCTGSSERLTAKDHGAQLSVLGESRHIYRLLRG